MVRSVDKLSALAIALCGFAVLSADGQTQVKKVPARATSTMAGQELFREYCAVCHGKDGKGDGPAATALKSMPADLTQISKKSGGKYPEIHVQRVINGEDAVVAHGSRDMPVWGQIFRHMSTNQDLGAVRVYNLVKYIGQIQAK
jgi:mono/diheme cytochrome c family protein